jgi:hypothetical protein
MRIIRWMPTQLASVLLCAGFLMAQAPQAPPQPKPPAADLNQLMRGLFFPHSNVVFAPQRQNPAEVKRAPEPSAATDPLNGIFGGWDAVENSALVLIEGADLLMVPGRMCSNGKPVPVTAPDWAGLVNNVREAGKIAYAAAKAKDMDKFLDVGDVLNISCATCHNKYRRATRCQ